MELFEKDSVYDLVLRGFDQEAILSVTGTDVGYHGCKVRNELSGIDRFAYKVEYVRTNTSKDDLLNALEKYATGTSKSDILAELGIPGENLVKLKRLFEALNLKAEFRDADRRQRKFAMSTGFEAIYGTDNPFKLDEFQQQAARTREEKYGAAYTLQKGSVFEPTARAKSSVAAGTEETKARRRKTNLAKYGVEHAIQAPEIKARSKATMLSRYGVEHYAQTEEAREKQSERALSRNKPAKALFDEDSAEDLILRGFGAVYIRRVTGVSYRMNKQTYLQHIQSIDRDVYCGQHIKTRVDRTVVLEALKDYGEDKMNRCEMQEKFGLWSHPVGHNFDLMRVFQIGGYLAEFEEASANRKAVVQAKIDATNLARYGGRPCQSEQVKAKIKQTLMNHYGVENASQAPEIKAKKQIAARQKYGVDCVLQSPEIRAKAKKTVLEQYGVENVSQSEVIKAKKVATSMEHYGVPTSALDPEVRAKQMRAVCKKYGIDPDSLVEGAGVLSLTAAREKARQTMLKKHGVDNPFKLDSVQEQIKEYWLEQYGVTNPSRVAEIQEIRHQTFLQKYGVDNPSYVPEIAEKIKEKSRKAYAERGDKIVAHMLDTKRERGTFRTSAPEESLYQMLIQKFGSDNVERQYRDKLRYPFACDFYIKSRDLFIELNASWTHGPHWYGSGTNDDEVIFEWESKHTEFYDNAVFVWSQRDVLKREMASVANLNYIVFWSNKLLDAELWFSMGCPDGHDWEQEFSWVPCRNISVNIEFPDSLQTARSFMLAAKAANGQEFYKRELNLWARNPGCKDGRIQGVLFANRYKYLHKQPDELSDAEILRGLGISNMVRAYTGFNAETMLQVLKAYNIKSVYDPCAGWGERLAGCGSVGIKYIGCDINPALQSGYAELIQHYGFHNIRTFCQDSATLDMTGEDFDAVFTCPPYGSREVYTELGAENLSEADFLSWWKQVVLCSTGQTTRWFMYQIDRAHVDEMNQVLEDCGWIFEKFVPVDVDKVRHENRAQGKVKKQNYEAIEIFYKI